MDKQELLLAAELSALAYVPDALSEFVTRHGGCVHHHPVGDDYAAIVYCPGGKAFVVFRGTDDLGDAKTDVKYRQVSLHSGGKAHRGVDAAYRRLMRGGLGVELLEIPKSTTVVVTGHSLGGMLAARASYEWVKTSGAKVYTFGAGRVFDPVAVSKVEIPVVRVQNGLDLVTMLPPPIAVAPVWLKGWFPSFTWCRYKHHGELLQIDSDGTVHSGSRGLKGDMLEILRAVREDVKDKDVVPSNIEDHFMSSGYLPHIRAYARQ